MRTKSGRAAATSTILLKLTPSERRRLKAVAVERDGTYAEVIMGFVDEHERAKERAGAVAKSPLHAGPVDE